MKDLKFNYVCTNKLYFPPENSLSITNDIILRLDLSTYPKRDKSAEWEFVSITYKDMVLVDSKDVK